MKVIRNDTPDALELFGADGRVLALAPFETRSSEKDDDGFDFATAKEAGIVSTWTETPSDVVEKTISLAFVLAFALVIVAATITSPDDIDDKSWPVRNPGLTWLIAAGLYVVIVTVTAIVQSGTPRALGRIASQAVSLGGILAIGVGLPAATIYWFGSGSELLRGASPEAFVRIVQLAFIATASLLPNLLFFLFDRYRLETIRTQLYRDLFRLDRRLRSRADVNARYGAQINETFGPESEGRGRLAPGTRWPVLLCTFVITLGWIVAFMPVGPVGAAALRSPLTPNPVAPVFGFLGAYFFALQLIARRYARGDLKPKVYGYITIRILTVAVLCWVLDAMTSSADEHWLTLVTAFLIGIVPEALFTLLREKVSGRGSMVPEAEKHPLTKLEGIDLYDRARLEQEGIVNVESFAHTDLIGLVLETRIPVPRLVDWIDQSILYLHVVLDSSDEGRASLRTFGVRTASDLLVCWDAAAKRNELDAFKKLLSPDGPPYRLEVVRDALLDDEWLHRVLDWRNDSRDTPRRLDLTPNSLDGKLHWARNLIGLNRYREAQRELEKALEIRDDPRVRVELARLLGQVPVPAMRNLGQSREHARHAFDLGKDDAEVLDRLIELHLDQRDWAATEGACAAAIALIGDPEHDSVKKARLAELEKIRKLAVEEGARGVANPTAVAG